ncbi:MAG: TetR/AcrR family transcriptional regulator [Cystobacter sp.]
MSAGDRASPRKNPRQARAKVTVELLLEAAAQVLVSSGYEGTTTKQVAERAGVSIGTLYQYFPSKEALVVMLIQRLQQRVFGVLSTLLRPRPVSDFAHEVRGLVRAMVELYAENQALQRVLLEVAPRITPPLFSQGVEMRVEPLIESMIAQNLRFEPPRNLGLVSFLIARALRNAIWDTVIERPELIGTDELVDELSAMVLGYLHERGGRLSTPPRR